MQLSIPQPIYLGSIKAQWSKGTKKLPLDYFVFIHTFYYIYFPVKEFDEGNKKLYKNKTNFSRFYYFDYL